ncbi:hypothetical protein BOX15_Mlig007154g1 [Macrostomum lignano]|uniref:Uncharacterized protein n=1 Tax=Macrostomum lignano TaxID=282301 RepID=A0A267H1E6_9PLAT|nr:hypothetical protein BOX15_Mlig007154g1 [Macrostomum lignano]
MTAQPNSDSGEYLTIATAARAEAPAPAAAASCAGSHWREYQQVLSNNASHSMPSSVWAEALTEMELTGGVQASQLLPLYRTALSSCPYSVQLWCQLIDCQVRSGATWPQVRDTCEAALNSGLHREDDIDALRTKMSNCAAAYGVSCPEESGDDDVIASSNLS